MLWSKDEQQRPEPAQRQTRWRAGRRGYTAAPPQRADQVYPSWLAAKVLRDQRGERSSAVRCGARPGLLDLPGYRPRRGRGLGRVTPGARLQVARRGVALPRGGPAMRPHMHQESGQVRSHHMQRVVGQQPVENVDRASGIIRPAPCRPLRRPFSTHLLEDGICTRQEPLGHTDAPISTISRDVLDRWPQGVRTRGDRGVCERRSGLGWRIHIKHVPRVATRRENTTWTW